MTICADGRDFDRPDDDASPGLGQSRCGQEPKATCAGATQQSYLILLETVVNVVDRAVPTAVTAVMMTTAMSAAIKPYSIAVAPSSLAMKRVIMFMLSTPKTPEGFECACET